MANWKQWVAYALEGTKYGALTYLIVLFLGIQPSAPTAHNILSVLLMSACIGLLSLLFSQDQLSPLRAMMIHFVGTSGLLMMMTIYNGWGDLLMSPRFWILFVVIYVKTWLISMWQMRLNTIKINQVLEKRKRES